MALAFWQVTQYQHAAVQMCAVLGEDPYAQDDQNQPHWFEYAKRMAEHHIMLEALSMYGMARW